MCKTTSGKGLCFMCSKSEEKHRADSYRWTTVDAFSNKEILLSMDNNSSVPVKHQNTYIKPSLQN